MRQNQRKVQLSFLSIEFNCTYKNAELMNCTRIRLWETHSLHLTQMQLICPLAVTMGARTWRYCLSTSLPKMCKWTRFRLVVPSIALFRRQWQAQSMCRYNWYALLAIATGKASLYELKKILLINVLYLFTNFRFKYYLNTAEHYLIFEHWLIRILITNIYALIRNIGYLNPSRRIDVLRLRYTLTCN